MAEICPFEVTPLAVPRVINNLPVYSLNYTNQEFYSIRARTLELIKNNFGKDFNDLGESSLAVMLVECWAAMADMLSFKIDQLANEFYIDTVTELENAFRLAKLVGYKPMPPLPAKTMFLVKSSAVYSQDIVINTPISINLDGIGFDLAYELFQADANNNPIFGESIIIPAGSMFTESVVGLEGMSKAANFTSNGKANQSYNLPFENVYFGSIRVSVNGVAWEEVEYFSESKINQEYIVEYDAYYKATIIFGDNKTGLVPPPNSSIVARYRVPNKSTSEIISGAFNTKVFGSLPGSGEDIVLSVTNYTKSEYGYPGDSIAEIKKKLPAFIRTQNRGVTGADYKYLTDTFATSFNGVVGKSNIALRNHGCAGNVIDVIILAKTGDQRLIKANDNLKQDLSKYLNKKKIFTDYICIKDGELIYVDVTINANISIKYKKLENEIRSKLLEKLGEFFDLPRWEFGNSLKEKEMAKFLSSVKEIKHFDIGFTTNKSIEDNKHSENVVTAKYNEVIRPDNIIINFTYESGDN